MKRISLVLFLLTVLLHSSLSQAQIKVTVYTDDFAGNRYELSAGRYDFMSLVRAGISTVKSVKVPRGMKVTLYERDNFTGTSLELTDDANKRYLEGKGFAQTMLNVSIVVEVLPANSPVLTALYVTLYKDDFAGATKNLSIGQYEFNELGNVDNDQLSSIKIPKGLKVTLYEHGGFEGRSLVLTKDTRAAFFVNNKFNDLTSSIVVEEVPAPVPVVPVVPVVAPKIKPAEPVVVPAVVEVIEKDPTDPIIYQGDFSGASKSLVAGRYSSNQLGIGNDQLSSIKVPNGFRVTLYDGDAYEGRALILTNDARADFLADNNFNNLTSSVLVEKLPMVTLYEGDYSGASKRLIPGKYMFNDLGLGNDQISSVRVPPGLRVTLYEHEAFQGRTVVLTQDSGSDILASVGFNDLTSSVVVEVIEKVPVILPVEPKPVITPVAPVIVVTPPVTPAPVVVTPSCEMTSSQFENARKAIELKSWDNERMETAKFASRDKCLTLLQIRTIAGFFMSEDQTLDYVKYAYDFTKEKSDYYQLEDIFKYPSSKDTFNKFLKSK